MNAEKLVAMTRSMARRITPEHAARWRDDIAQEACLRVIESGLPCSWRVVRWETIGAMRSLLGDHRHRAETEERLVAGVDDERAHALATVSDRDRRTEERSIALWRLQRVFPTLTDAQQSALLHTLSGADFGRGNGSAANACKTAIARIADPSVFSRVAKERDPARNARERQRRHRERKRAA